MQGRWAEAIKALEQALALYIPQDPYQKPVMERKRLCEEMQALEVKLAGFLSGQFKPSDADEQLALARLCQWPSHKYLASAARFYADAFSARPELAENLLEGTRYDAARAAARAGSGQEEYSITLDDKERYRLRKQALDWLRADLLAWTKTLDLTVPKARETVDQQMRNWMSHPDLAGVRDKASLANLADKERSDWPALWVNVDALLKRPNVTGGKNP